MFIWLLRNDFIMNIFPQLTFPPLNSSWSDWKSEAWALWAGSRRSDLNFKWFFPLGLNFSQSQHKNIQKKSNFPMEIAYVDFSSLIFIDSKKWTLFLAKIHVELDDSAFFGKLKPAYLKPVQTNHRKNFSTLMANANNQVLNMWFLQIYQSFFLFNYCSLLFEE